MDSVELTRLRKTKRSRHRLTLFCLLLLGACSAFDFGDEESSSTGFQVRGIDVSYYQGDIDWHSVRQSGNHFAYLKATEGGDAADPKFAEYWRGAAAAGLKRGAYHFWYHCRPGSEQAAWFIQNVPKDPDALPPVLDMEWTPDSPTCTSRADRETISKDMQDWLTAVEAYYGKRPVIYTSVDFYQDRLVDNFLDYPLFVRSVAGHPSIRYGGRKWHFWQYTATGVVAGINGNVDQNVFYGSVAEWQKFLDGGQKRAGIFGN